MPRRVGPIPTECGDCLRRGRARQKGAPVNVRVHGKNMQVSDELRELALDKIEHAGRIFDDGGSTDVEFAERVARALGEDDPGLRWWSDDLRDGINREGIVADLLESDRVIFPVNASVLSAFGTLVSPVRIDSVEPLGDGNTIRIPATRSASNR